MPLIMLPYMTNYYLPIEIGALRLLLAAVLAFIVGIDRELKSKPYGIRPYMIVAVGTTAFVLMMTEMMHETADVGDHIAMDPVRIISGIIAGVGFLGAAAIMRGQHQTVGATTGTGLWLAGALGVACGLGYYEYAIIITILAVIIMAVLGRLHDRIQNGKSQPQSLSARSNNS